MIVAVNFMKLVNTVSLTDIRVILYTDILLAYIDLPREILISPSSIFPHNFIVMAQHIFQTYIKDIMSVEVNKIEGNRCWGQSILRRGYQ